MSSRAMQLAALTCFLAFGPLTANAETLIVFSGSAEDTYISSYHAESLGNRILWQSDLTDKDGNRIGSNAGSYEQISRDGHYICDFVKDHDGHGMMTFSGVQAQEPGTSRITITGGTGDYEGATGMLSSRPIENRSRFRFDIQYNLPPNH